MMWSDFAGDAQAALLGPADLFERSFCGEVRDVKARACELGELNVARDANGFCRGWHAGQT